MKAERREQILDAYEACVARHGVEGATLERTAELAGLARPLIRHHLGNREALLQALAERFLERSDAAMAELVEALPGTGRAEALVEYLFDPAYADATLVQVSGALINAGREDAALAGRMRDWVRGFAGGLRAVLAEAFPDADAKRLDAAAAGLTGLYFNIDALTPLGPMPDLRTASKQAAMLLLERLAEA
jgi:AcrR family transcriptional regulator